MKRLIVGSLVSVPLFALIACSGDPTENLRNGIAQVNATPSQVFVQVGRTTNVDATATDEQGNLISTSFQATNGSAISVVRDPTFQPIFVNDTQAVAPGEATTFRFKVTANALGSESFTITAGDKSTTVPVSVTRDPTVPPPLATVTSTGPTAADATVLTLPAPYAFPEDASVSFGDAGNAILVDRAADGSSITIFPPPGAADVGTVVIGLSYLLSDTATTTTDVPLTISTTVPPQPGTDDPATAPTITLPAPGATTAFYDGAAFGSPVCGVSNDGIPCQLYKISLPADGSFDATLGWSNTTDLGLYVLTADGTGDADQACDDLFNGDEGGQEACTITLPAGDYLLAVVNFGEFYDPVDPPPDWISLAITTPAAE